MTLYIALGAAIISLALLGLLFWRESLLRQHRITLDKVRPVLEGARDEQIRLRAELDAAHARFDEFAAVDPATGLPNERCFQRDVRMEWGHTLRFKRPIALIYAAIDDFPAFSDNASPELVVELLRNVGGTLEAESRRISDRLFLLSGNRFAILLREVEPAGAFAVAERMQLRIHAMGILKPSDPHGGSLTLAMGVATSTSHRPGQSADDLVHAAEQALRAAQSAGTGRIATRVVEAPTVN
ncbi:MAG: GGDEF domain-containing protein [Gammaproteobacteria bacterium]